MSENPYAPPGTDAPPPELVAPPGPRRMPGPVIAVLVLVSVYVLVALGSAIADPVRTAVELPILALIIVGLVRGHPLAWQWGMILPLLAALFQAVGLLALLSRPVGDGGVALVATALLALLIAANLAIPILLARRSARLFFGLQCSTCGGLRVKAASFLFNRLRCRTCNASWGRPPPRNRSTR